MVGFIHATVGRAHHAFSKELRQLQRDCSNIKGVVFYENADPDDIPGLHHDEVGRLTLDSLRQHLPLGNAEYYYCGPIGFMDAVEGFLDHLKIPLHRRYSEAFGPDPSFATAIARV